MNYTFMNYTFIITFLILFLNIYIEETTDINESCSRNPSCIAFYYY